MLRTANLESNMKLLAGAKGGADDTVASQAEVEALTGSVRLLQAQLAEAITQGQVGVAMAAAAARASVVGGGVLLPAAAARVSSGGAALGNNAGADAAGAAVQAAGVQVVPVQAQPFNPARDKLAAMIQVGGSRVGVWGVLCA